MTVNITVVIGLSCLEGYFILNNLSEELPH